MGMTTLHPAQNRGFRELHAYSRQLEEHWSTLADRVPEGAAERVLREGADEARGLIAELEPLIAQHDLFAGPAANAAGQFIAGTINGLRDRSLERNQALRFAVEDAEHVATLLAYLGTVAECRDQAEIAEFCGRWQGRIRTVQEKLRAEVAALGEDPDAAIEPLDSSPLGRAAHKAGFYMGSFGEWLDRRRGRRPS